MRPDLRVRPKQCPVCSGALTPLQQWGATGGDLARCKPCRKLFVVTSLPHYHEVRDREMVIGGAWFVNVCHADAQKLGLDFDQLERFDALLNVSDLDAARAMVEEPRADAGRMALELRFYERLDRGFPPARLRPYLESSIDFLLDTDPFTYILPIDEQLPPRGGDVFDNPYEYLPTRSTVVVFKPNLGRQLRDRHGLLVDEVLAELDESRDPRLLSRSREKLIADHAHYRWPALDYLLSPYWTAKTTRQLKTAGELYGMSLNSAKGGNEQDAVAWHHQAAELGLAEARYTLGLRYASGRGVPKNEEQARRWFRKAAEAMESRSTNILAMRYGQGGILKGDNQAWESYLTAAWDRAISNTAYKGDTSA